MTRPFSLAFKQKMVQRQNLSRWLQEARSLPLMTPHHGKSRHWSVEKKARVVAAAAALSGEDLRAYLDREDIRFVDFERWRIALEDDGRESTATTKRIRKLERELARKEKALAEAAALLVLKKTISKLAADEDEDTDDSNGS